MNPKNIEAPLKGKTLKMSSWNQHSWAIQKEGIKTGTWKLYERCWESFETIKSVFEYQVTRIAAEQLLKLYYEGFMVRDRESLSDMKKKTSLLIYICFIEIYVKSMEETHKVAASILRIYPKPSFWKVQPWIRSQCKNFDLTSTLNAKNYVNSRIIKGKEM